MSQPIELAALSRFAARALHAQPALGSELTAPQVMTRAEMDAALSGAAGEPEPLFRRRLRQLRNRVLLRVMARDLVAQAPLEEVCATMSDLAEVALGAALECLGAQELVVVGMGKL